MTFLSFGCFLFQLHFFIDLFYLLLEFICVLCSYVFFSIPISLQGIVSSTFFVLFNIIWWNWRAWQRIFITILQVVTPFLELIIVLLLIHLFFESILNSVVQLGTQVICIFSGQSWNLLLFCQLFVTVSTNTFISLASISLVDRPAFICTSRIFSDWDQISLRLIHLLNLQITLRLIMLLNLNLIGHRWLLRTMCVSWYFYL